MKLTIAENFRAVFYAPFYALRALELAEREGLQIEWLPGERPGGAIDEVKRGRIDAQFGGPMRVMKDHEQIRKSIRDCPHDASRNVLFSLRSPRATAPNGAYVVSRAVYGPLLVCKHAFLWRQGTTAHVYPASNCRVD